MRTRGSYSQLVAGKTVAWADLTPSAGLKHTDHLGRPLEAPRRKCRHCDKAIRSWSHFCSDACEAAGRKQKPDGRVQLARKAEKAQLTAAATLAEKGKVCLVCGRLAVSRFPGVCSQTCHETKLRHPKLRAQS